MIASAVVNKLLEDLESRMPYFLRQFPDIGEYMIRQVAQNDPTGYKYTEWLLKLYRRDVLQRQVNPGWFLAKTRGALLSHFDRLKNTRHWAGSRDINQYSDFEALEDPIVDALGAEAERPPVQREQEKPYLPPTESERREGQKTLARHGDFKLVRFNGVPAICDFGKGRLCTGRERNALLYLRQGGLYGIFKNGLPFAQYSPFYHSFRYMNNERVSASDIAKLKSLFDAANMPLPAP